MKYLAVFILLAVSTSNGWAQKRIVSPEEAEYLRLIEKQKVAVPQPSAPARQVAPSAENKAMYVPPKELEAPAAPKPMPQAPAAKAAPLTQSPAQVSNEPKKLPPLIKKESSGGNKIYRPAPVVDQAEQNGYLIERDSTKIVNVKMSQSDTLNVKVCYSAGVSIALDDSLNGESFQRVIIDDSDYFEAKEFDNKRGTHFRLKEPIQPGFYWESALRLTLESNDRVFLINLLGVPCPDGPNPFPKVYYIGSYTEKLGGINTSVMTPEDTIIQASEGLPRKSQNVIRVYDMVTSAGSNYAVFGVEIQYHKTVPEKEQLLMKVLDNYQTTVKKSNMVPLKLQSEKASENYGVPTLRFNLIVNIDKDYIINRRYIYLMVLSKATNHYQYQQIDLLPYFMSLKKRGFKL